MAEMEEAVRDQVTEENVYNDTVIEMFLKKHKLIYVESLRVLKVRKKSHKSILSKISKQINGSRGGNKCLK